MDWFLIALIPPALWATSNYIEKFLVNKNHMGVGTLMIFSSLIGLPLLPLIFLIRPDVVSSPPQNALLIVLNSCLYLLGALFSLKALEKNDVSSTIPIWQLIPVISYFLARIFLNETLTINQIFGGLIIVSGAILISLERHVDKKIRLNRGVLFLMSLSSFFYALNFLFFKYFAIKSDYWKINFYEYLGFVLFAIIILVFIKSYRIQFLTVVSRNWKTVISLNGINETINIAAKLIFNFVSLLTPIALAWVFVGFQPVFALIFGTVLTMLFPHIIKERISKKILLQKIIVILIMFVGAYILNS